MGGPLEGVRAVELGVVIAGPACATLLADWGASVIKIEPPEGDPQRGNTNTAYFELDNRGKRSVCLDLKNARGREILFRLLGDADVLVTNMRLSALTRLGLDYASLSARFPALVYAAITGYGATGEGADKAGYDIGAYWSRSGMALAVTQPGTSPPVSRPGMGDHPTGLAMAAGICAALVEQRRTGRGQFVTTSLLRTGCYVIGSDLVSHARGERTISGLRRMLYNPLLAVYQAGDGQWFWLLGVQATRHWPGVTRAIGRPELATDPRFATMDMLVRNRDEVLALLDEAFAAEPLAYWAEAFAREDVWWDPLLTFDQIRDDPLVRAAGVFREVADTGAPTVATPVDFPAVAPGPVPRAPEAGEHTEQVLLELGYDWSDIVELKDSGAVP